MFEEKIIQAAIAIIERRLVKPSEFFCNTNKTKQYLRLQLSGLDYESFRVMFLNSQHGLIKTEEMSRGTIDTATVYPREVVKAALHFNAAAVILSHNHPSGKIEPSSADMQITEQLRKALQLIEVRVLDHFVIGEDQAYSFAEHGLI